MSALLIWGVEFKCLSFRVFRVISVISVIRGLSICIVTASGGFVVDHAARFMVPMRINLLDIAASHEPYLTA